jgi:hypothetical protein
LNVAPLKQSAASSRKLQVHDAIPHIRIHQIRGRNVLAPEKAHYHDAPAILTQDAGAESSRRFPCLPAGRLWRREIPREDLPGSRFSSEKAGAIAQLALRYRKVHRFSAATLATPRGRGVVSELDIYRAANLLIDRHGGDALVAAAQMIDRMLELGDPEGRQV